MKARTFPGEVRPLERKQLRAFPWDMDEAASPTGLVNIWDFIGCLEKQNVWRLENVNVFHSTNESAGFGTHTICQFFLLCARVTLVVFLFQSIFSKRQLFWNLGHVYQSTITSGFAIGRVGTLRVSQRASFQHFVAGFGHQKMHVRFREPKKWVATAKGFRRRNVSGDPADPRGGTVGEWILTRRWISCGASWTGGRLSFLKRQAG